MPCLEADVQGDVEEGTVIGGAIFSNSNLGKAQSANKLKLPDDTPNSWSTEHPGPMPYVDDEAFPLHTHLMRPFPGRGCPVEQQAFIYRLSRALW